MASKPIFKPHAYFPKSPTRENQELITSISDLKGKKLYIIRNHYNLHTYLHFFLEFFTKEISDLKGMIISLYLQT